MDQWWYCSWWSLQKSTKQSCLCTCNFKQEKHCSTGRLLHTRTTFTKTVMVSIGVLKLRRNISYNNMVLRRWLRPVHVCHWTAEIFTLKQTITIHDQADSSHTGLTGAGVSSFSQRRWRGRNTAHRQHDWVVQGVTFDRSTGDQGCSGAGTWQSTIPAIF